MPYQSYIDPKHTQFHLDTCAFDPKYAPEDTAANQMWDLYEAEILNLVLAHSVQKEIDHLNTPAWVKARATEMVYTLRVNLTAQEKRAEAELERIMKGNASSNKHQDDARHLFEAAKYGAIFVTTDARILNKAKEISSVASVQILKPSEVVARLEVE